MDTTTTLHPLARTVTVPCPECGQLNRVDLERVTSRPACGACHGAMQLDRPIPADDTNFDRIVREAAVPVIVDLYADWCGPCRMMAPVFAQLAERQAGSALVVKLDTDRSPATSGRLGIRAIPTLIVFRDGKEVARQVGATSLARLESLLDSAR